MTKLSEELAWRGMVNQTTFADLSALDQESFTFYWGVDPSADSMTIGNLAAAMVARQFVIHGHKPILLAGGATGLIGDPDGKKQERDTKDPELVEKNVTGLSNQLKAIFSGTDFEVVNNYDWFKTINYLDFLREIGKNVSLTQMLDRDFVKERIGEGGSGISYAEFSYSLIQGYDFLHLFRTRGAKMQLAGSDQWGNSITGVELIRRLEGAEAHVFTTPLVINKQTGVKFGKSEGGAIWLDADKTSPYKFYQFWLNCDDEFSEDLVKIYTTLDRETIEDLVTRHRSNPGKRELQKTLAYEVTKFIHGEVRASSVRNISEVLFSGQDFKTLSQSDLQNLEAEIPTTTKGQLISDILIVTEIAKSKRIAKQLIESGAITVNGAKISEDASLNEVCLVKKGKNTFILVK